MKHLIKFFVFAAMIVFAAVSCLKDDNDLEKEKPSGEVAYGVMQKVDLEGTVWDENDNPANGVSVKSGTTGTTTNSRGEFHLSQVDVVNGRIMVTFEKNGYFTLVRSAARNDETVIEAILTPTGNSDNSQQTTFNSSEAKTLTFADGMKLSFPSSSVMYADGTSYSGTVKADLLYFDSRTDDLWGKISGGDFMATDRSGNNFMFFPWGMLTVHLTDNAGKPLQIKTGSSVDVSFPVPPDIAFETPPSISLYTFDLQKGIWMEEGAVTLQGNAYTGKVTHFSDLAPLVADDDLAPMVADDDLAPLVDPNAPKKEFKITVQGQVTDCKGNPIPKTRVHIIRFNKPDIVLHTDKSGNYSTEVSPKGEDYIGIRAYDKDRNATSEFVPTKVYPFEDNDFYYYPDITANIKNCEEPKPEAKFYVKAGSIRYKLEQTGWEPLECVYTWDNYGLRERLDRWLHFYDYHYNGSEMPPETIPVDNCCMDREDCEYRDMEQVATMQNLLNQTRSAYEYYYEDNPNSPIGKPCEGHKCGFKWTTQSWPYEFFLGGYPDYYFIMGYGNPAYKPSLRPSFLGYTKQANRVYAGKTCTVYTLTHGSAKHTVAFWNEIVLYSERIEEDGTKTVYTASRVTVTVPEWAFVPGSTATITWI